MKKKREINEELLKEALNYINLGFSVIPLTGKTPTTAWKEYQSRPPTVEEIEKLFTNTNVTGVGIITGMVSGNLVVLDFDSKEEFLKFFEELKKRDETLYKKLKNTWIVETGKGFHVYFRLLDRVPKTRHRLGDGSVDIKAEGGCVVAPPSVHPTGKRYRFVKRGSLAVLSWDEYKTIERLLTPEQREHRVSGESRDLRESEILEIVNLLRQIYKVGYRDLVVLYTTGWLRKAGITYETARKIIELLAESDEEYDKRIYVLDRTYGLKGTQPTTEDLKGKMGLQEIAETILGEERALNLIRRLEEILKTASPFGDAIFSLIDFNRKQYYVADVRRGIITKAFEKDGQIIYERLICEVCPKEITVYEDPLGGPTKFEISFTGIRELHLGTTDLDSIIARLTNEGVVKNSRLLRDALSSVIIAYIRKGKAKIRREIDKPGFYYIDGQVKHVKWEPEEFSKEDLKRALELLHELRTVWYKRAGPRFTTTVKWGLLSPFAYAIKQLRQTTAVHFPDIVLYGSRDSGKTTIGSQIILSIWNPPEEARIIRGAGEADTKAKHGRLRSLTTFPVIVNEVEGVFKNRELLEDYKTAVENRFVRGKHVQGVYMEIPSLSPFFMTMNSAPPIDSAIRKRFLCIHFSLSDKFTRTEMEEFKEKVLPRLKDLRFLGYYVYKRIESDPTLLEKDWTTTATELLKDAFVEVGMTPPQWVEEFYEGEDEEDVNMVLTEEIRYRLLEDVNSTYARFYKLVTPPDPDAPQYYRLKELLSQNLISWAILKGTEDVIITSSIMNLLKETGVDSLKSLAEYMDWEYKAWRIGKRVIKGAKTSLRDFAEFLYPNDENMEENEGDHENNDNNDDNSGETTINEEDIRVLMDEDKLRMEYLRKIMDHNDDREETRDEETQEETEPSETSYERESKQKPEEVDGKEDKKAEEVESSDTTGATNGNCAYVPIIVTEDVPPIAGVDGRTYELKKGGEYVIPAPNAKILLKNGVARLKVDEVRLFSLSQLTLGKPPPLLPLLDHLGKPPPRRISGSSSLAGIVDEFFRTTLHARSPQLPATP